MTTLRQQTCLIRTVGTLTSKKMRKNMFRVALIATMILTAGVFASCGGDEDDNNGNNPNPNPTTINDTTFVVNNVSFKMIAVKAGTFMMGANEDDAMAANNEKPRHQVTLTKNYWIGETEVTQELWQAVTGNNPSYFTGTNFPVEQVSWNDIQTFITALNQLTGNNFHLPTEAEWEFAARGGNQSHNYLYSGSNTINDVAWYPSNSNHTTHQVKTKQPNELGIYDMSGNVWEWVNDWYSNYTSDAQTDPQGPAAGSTRVLRGGSYSSGASDTRVASRSTSLTPTNYGSHFGFRLACSSI
jgi:formylglycine-generating enzyme required for sulfatase activity